MSPFSFDNLKLVTRKKMFERFHLKVLVVFFLSFFLFFFHIFVRLPKIAKNRHRPNHWTRSNTTISWCSESYDLQFGHPHKMFRSYRRSNQGKDDLESRMMLIGFFPYFFAEKMGRSSDGKQFIDLYRDGIKEAVSRNSSNFK